ACEDEGLPLLPGAATTSEIMALLERGYTVQKFFPAEQSGGVTFLKSIGSPIPQVKFCPTGGINLKNASDYLSLENTLCVGGSWVAPREAIISKNWTAINKLATEAKRLRYSIF
ncbi:MAG: keto-deoxy-phosphogluconate aldolase, partial [Rhodobacteraceae bacterium]|nr:keto-deoxy-phosphogluconate aldolase [Paracoccaceae bacterium]